MRHAGQIRLGFYPCPPEAVALAASRLVAPAAPFALLDPCAGRGAAVGQLAALLGCRPDMVHAVELDEVRGADLQAALPEAKVLTPASFNGCRATWGSFSLAWTNPPFDTAFGGGRVEADFVRQATEWLMPGGVLVLVCPAHVVERGWTPTCCHLLQWFDDITVLEFPASVRRFEEVIVLATKRDKMAELYARNWEKGQAPAGHVYHVPPGDGPRTFAKVEMTELEVQRLLAASPLRVHLQEVPPFQLPSPPLALGTGHIALLLASGHLDGVVRPPGESAHVVRGTARKVEYVASCETTEDDEGREKTVTVRREKIQLVVRAVDATGTLFTFGEDKADE